MLPVPDCSRVGQRTAGLVFVTWSGHALAGSRSANTFHPRKGKPIARWGRKATGLRSPLFSQDRRSPGCRRGGVVTTPFIPGPASVKSFSPMLFCCTAGPGHTGLARAAPLHLPAPQPQNPRQLGANKRKPRRREGCVQKKFLGRFDVTSPHTQGSAAKPASPWAILCRPIRGYDPSPRPAQVAVFYRISLTLTLATHTISSNRD